MNSRQSGQVEPLPEGVNGWTTEHYERGIHEWPQPAFQPVEGSRENRWQYTSFGSGKGMMI